MNLIRCERGHFYDADVYVNCPHCNGTTAAEEEIGVTVAKEQTIANTVSLTAKLDEAVNKAKGEDDGQKTIGFYSASVGTEPVVGWLVCVEGEHYGSDFALKTGRNFIGRADNMDVVLYKDKAISREKHAVVLFEPRNNVFLVQPGDSRELFYINGNVVLDAQEIKAYDKISLGETTLVFIPFCNEEINWNNYKNDK